MWEEALFGIALILGIWVLPGIALVMVALHVLFGMPLP